jgi:hypothetical protein
MNIYIYTYIYMFIICLIDLLLQLIKSIKIWIGSFTSPANQINQFFDLI